MKFKKTNDIITVPSLKSFFYESLSQVNQSASRPLPQEAIFYSSDVLDRYTLSKDYFEKIDGRVQEKVLGMKLLEASQKPQSEQVKIFKDVAETTLILCGCFSSSVEKKLVGFDYYRNIGKMAFNKLDYYNPSFMNMPCFFKFMSSSFDKVTSLIDLMNKSNSPQRILEAADMTSEDASILGITLLDQKKIS